MHTSPFLTFSPILDFSQSCHGFAILQKALVIQKHSNQLKMKWANKKYSKLKSTHCTNDYKHYRQRLLKYITNIILTCCNITNLGHDLNNTGECNSNTHQQTSLRESVMDKKDKVQAVNSQGWKLDYPVSDLCALHNSITIIKAVKMKNE